MAYYRGKEGCRNLLVLVYDPGQRLHEPGRLEAEWASEKDDMLLRCVIAW
jgi:hypothetical protein